MKGTLIIQFFGNHFLDSFNIQTGKIVKHVPTEILTIGGEKYMIEDLFQLDDDTLLHIAYQSSAKPKDLDQLFVNLMWYDLKIYEKHEKLISTIVVLGPEVFEAELRRDLGAIKYRVTDAIWLSRWNGDQISEELTSNVMQNGELTDEDLSKLVLLPFMQTNVSRYQVAVEVFEIVNQLFDHGKRDVVLKLIKTMAGKLLTGDYDQVVQALK